MNICIPIDADSGLDSQVCSHFGSAPSFLVVDTKAGTCRAIPNGAREHRHGMCKPLDALAGEALDAVVVGGIGAGALSKLLAAHIRVYLSQHAKVRDAVAAIEAGTLPLMQPGMACAHHGQGHS